MRPVPLLFLALLSLACAGDPTTPPSHPIQHSSVAQYSSVAASSAAEPNVIRFADEFAVGIYDPEADLVAWAGLPSNPDNLIGCGGTEPYQSGDFQFVGVLHDAIRALVKADHVNLHVFRLSTFGGCGSVPIAQGVGRLMYTDSDIFWDGEGNDTWGFRMEGTVALASGGTAHLVAHNRWQIQPNGTQRLIFRDVKLLGH